ncbi:hypothetical protein JCM5350_005100 [Sporobolomyces pararoseus]
MSVFPAVGTVYPSLLAFKLDSFERGLRNSLCLITQRSKLDCYQEICCSIKVGLQRAPCAFRVVAKKIEGVVRVTQVGEDHSCLQDQRERNEEEARQIMSVRVEKVKKQLAMEEVESVSIEHGTSYDELVSETDGEAAEEEDEDDEDREDCIQEWLEEQEEEEEEEVEFRRKGKSNARKRANAASGQSDIRKRARSMFPTKADLQVEIKTLSQKGPVSLPTSDQRFDSARDLLLQLHTFAVQNHFSIYRWSSHLLTSRLKMTFTRRTNRFKDAPGGVCRYEIHAEEIGQSGKWRLVQTVGSHNHTLASFKKDLTSPSLDQLPAVLS